jgi:AraC family L-rhamnose operon transcriptional activator RhaR/AraC family L-rhamnose operon regulatory protein RhaS
MAKILLTKEEYNLGEITGNFPLNVMFVHNKDHVLHKHDFTELVVVDAGRGVHVTQSLRHEISAGDVLIIPRGMKHGYEDTDNLSIVNIIFSMSLIEGIPGDIKHIPGFYSLFRLNSTQLKRHIKKRGFLSLDAEETAFVRHCAGRINRELKEERDGYKSVCTLSLADLIIYLSRKASRHNIESHSENIAEILSYMEKNYNKEMTLEKLSNRLKLSPRSFQRLFKAYLGTSPFKHLLCLRLRHAGKILLATELSITEIAELTGFSDSAYFARQFKKFYRMTPRKYRDSQKK